MSGFAYAGQAGLQACSLACFLWLMRILPMDRESKVGAHISDWTGAGSFRGERGLGRRLLLRRSSCPCSFLRCPAPACFSI